jgi:putative ABC transport system permease protein
MREEPRWRRYGRLFGTDSRADTEEELRFHQEMRVRDYMRRGMGEAEAREAAALRLGDLDAVRRECGRVGEEEARKRRRAEWFSELRQDVRYGARLLRRAGSFTPMAVLTLALGIGATTAIFSLVHAVLYAPLPYAQPERLVQVWETSPTGGPRNVVSPGNALDWRERARSFSELAAYRNPYGMSLTGSGEATRVVASEVQPAVMRALDVQPLLGRTLLEEDALAGGDVVVLSHALWRERFGGDRSVVGQRLVLNDVPYTVVGVMPPEFGFPDARPDLWRALREASLDPEERRGHNLYMIGRLAPGVTAASAQAEMSTIAAGIAREHPQHMTGYGVNVVPLHRDLTAHVRPLFTVLLAGVIVVLLITCVNLANLLLARAVAREREMSVRGALGAGRARITRQLLTESVLLAVLGAAAALLLAPALLHMLVAAAPADIPRLERAVIDGRIMLFVAGIALGCALLFGVAPAVRLARTDLQAVLRGARDASHAGHTRLRSALLVAQVALSVVLLVGAGLFIRSFAALSVTPLGFDDENLVTIAVDLPRSRYGDQPQQIAFHERFIERVRTMPGVLSAAGTIEPPGGGYGMTFSFGIEGRPALNESGREDPEELRAVTPGYFDMLAQRVVRGRAIDEHDRADAVPVAMINESLARKHWPDEDPIGRRIALQPGETPWLEIIGVVADVRLASPDSEPIPALYIPYAQKAWGWMSWLTVVARTSDGVDANAMKEPLRAALLDLDGDLPPQSVRTVAEAFRDNTARRTFAMTLIAGFGAVALLLSIVGLYGLLAYTVAQQQQEIGVRLALGAHPGDIVRSVLVRSLALALPGAAVGVVAAAAATRTISTLLYGVSPIDVPTYAATLLLVIVTALVAAGVPAWRAARVSPQQALRPD